MPGETALLSVIIPVYNRPELLRYSLQSVSEAAHGMAVEVIVVDDGSEPPIAVPSFDHLPIKLIRQANAGSIPARIRGFEASAGAYIQFLDSDDLVARDKFRLQLDQLERTGADLVYCDADIATLDRPAPDLQREPTSPYASVRTVAEFCFRAQPCPHSPIYRRSLVATTLGRLVVQPERRFDPVGDTWLYYNLSVVPGKAEKTAAILATIGRHPGARYSRHWEHLAIAAWHLMVDFARHCPAGSATEEARRNFGETCFMMWRALPRDFDPQFEETLVAMWRAAPPSDRTRLGGRGFRIAAALLGTECAGRVFRRWQRRAYAEIATIEATDQRRLLDGERGSGRP